MKTSFRFAILLLGLSAGCLSQAQPEAAPNTATLPVLRPNNDPWLKRHEGFVESAKKAADCELLFIGDSITDNWRKPEKGLPVWEKEYAPHHAVNLGISGDRTQHLLWRLQNGELGAMHPRVVVMMIGTNNVGYNADKVTPRNQPAEIAAGIGAIVQYLRQQLPDAKILLLAVFPRGEKDSWFRAQVVEVNRLVAPLGDDRHVFYLDIGPKFLEPDGTLPKTIMPELLHPDAQGYVIWADAIRPALERLLK